MPPTSPSATAHDTPRQDATGPDFEFILTIEDVADRYASAGHPRTLRTIQRYCKKGHLDSRRVATMGGEKYLVAPYSVARHIAETNEIIAVSGSASGHDTPRPDATGPDTEFILTIDEVADRYAAAGHPRTFRTIGAQSADRQ
jgi:hypothetical protein